MLTGNRTPLARLREGDGDGFVTSGSELELVREEVVSFVDEAVASANRTGAVVAMSGGIDSTLTAALAVDALGSDRVLGLGLPCRKLDEPHATDARTLAEGLGIEYREVNLRPLLDAFEDSVAPEISTNGTKRAIGNVVARLRMACAYYAANARSLLVLGTANRSELLLGYFTKHGDGAADLYPIGDLYKTEVRALAQRVGVPRRIINKESTAGLWAGQTDRDDLGAPYETIDALLTRIIDRGERVPAAADEIGVDEDTAREIAARYVDTVHKRNVPPTPGLTEDGAGKSAYPLHLLGSGSTVDP
ncbi:NAD+ synthase [Halostella sp. JP-L12]|uniref:NAD+ synthase n=1 Tax=Halostella TaxID=1843185 RepID=UPI000EF796DA|nr:MULTISPECIES: NAD+ synthase [Halostella]NHN46315.1 NAD+ synthase [Halostella sp. JP-L12]